ncbi:alpha/beta hydrolase [Phycicoccus endophyticus]|uniref:Alpha/beta hydrolase n=1 Tax=Phycicoccus endophyticus TaxID=1690220 RepID=A0A7G9QZW4_9MICO|nr:alpha/beta hydrolase [Phycicoccus endophyticus]NHI20092.1 alpha/beta hydrolase [Phycicoccus endophyticus]QNN48889.1 alpha/beta hydrolase [Phycicoccus endophyticus]GGL45472.1 lipase [Phycicoccus endophyticus]
MSDAEVTPRPARAPDRTEVTGPEQTDVYDVYEPEAHRARGVTVALVHGGFWRARYDRAHLAPLAEALARDGFHTANLEYPRTGMPGGGWPGTADALRATVDAVRADSDLPDPLVLVGHSAGGHLVTWLASEHRVPDLLGAVGLGAVADLAEADRLHLGDDAARSFLGGAPEEVPQAWAAADPARQHLSAPVALVSGERDDVVPASVSQAYAAARTGDEHAGTATARGADHFDLVDPEHPAYLLLLAEVEELTLP